MRRRTSRTWWSAIGLFGLLCAAATSPVSAQIQLDPLFTKEAVLQQGMKVPVFGTGAAGEPIQVALQDQRETTVVDVDGRWQVEFKPLQPGGPFLMNVQSNRIILTQNVMVGEVWIFAGGSNMQWQVLESEGAGGIIAHVGNRDMRLFVPKRLGAMEPRFASEALGWHAGGAASVGTFSAVGYYFGRALHPHLKVPDHPELKVPLGLISCNHFDSSIESWISREALQDSAELKVSLEQPISAHKTRSPTVLFNAMVKPLTRFAVRGVVWYHGESEIDRAYGYRTALAALIADWRKQWGRPDLPFIIVQQAPYKVIAKTFKESKLAELRDSQWSVCRQIPNTTLVVITEYGDQFNPHPPQKEPVGRRAALVARGAVYGEKIVYQGPTYVSTKFGRNEATIRFQNIGGGLATKEDAELTGFFLSGSDHVFHEGKAVIQGDTVIVTSTQVAAPEAVRYGWADYPTCNLINKEGLPASPFRTDNYPVLTSPKEAN